MKYTQIALLHKYGLAIRGFRGQHLLVDPNIQRKIVELVHPKPKEWILEIGPGLGALTGKILEAGAQVIAVEKDRRFCGILEAELGAQSKGRLRIENADILKTDLTSLRGGGKEIPRPSLRVPRSGAKQSLGLGTGSAILSEIASPAKKRGGLAMTGKAGLKVVSNLPYYITSPVLFWLIENRARIEKAVLMMQREVANRLLAQPGEKDYGRLTLAVRYYADTHKAFHVSRNCFIPRPDVDSTVVTLEFHPSSKFPKGIDEDFLFHLIQTAFGARRKTLLNRLAGDPQIAKSRAELLELFGELKIPEKSRAEDLLLKDFIVLAGYLKS